MKKVFQTILIVFICISNITFVRAANDNALNVTGGVINSDYTYVDGTITILKSTSLTISGTTTTDHIVVNDGVSANLTINNLSIDNNSYNPIVVNNNAILNLTITGNNSIKSNNEFAAICVKENASLIIDGSLNDILNVNARDTGAAIGSDYYNTAGNITINGGKIIAKSLNGAAIGGGYYLGNITRIIINGGYIEANYNGTRIGIGSSGNNPSGGDIPIVINDGIVKANGIGAFFDDTTTNNKTSINGGIVESKSKICTIDQSNWKGIVSMDTEKLDGVNDFKNFKVYGSTNLNQHWTLLDGYTLSFENNSVLNVASNVTFTVEGSVNGATKSNLINNGTLYNNGDIQGDIGGTGPVTYAVNINYSYMNANGQISQEVSKGQSMSDVIMTANSGYYFPESSELYKETNGIKVERLSSQQIKISGTPTNAVTLSLSATLKNTIDSVNITDITQPVAGQSFDTEAVLNTQGVIKQDIKWRLNENFITGNADYNSVYTVNIYLKTLDEYQFANDVTATINDNNAIVTKDNDNIIVSYTFTKTGKRPNSIQIDNTKTEYHLGETMTISLTNRGQGNGEVQYQCKGPNNENVTINNNHISFPAVGEYTLTATKAEDDQYLSATDTIRLTVKYLETPDNPYTISHNGYYSDSVPVVITPKDGYTISTSQNGNYESSLSISQDYPSKSLKVYLKNSDGYLTDAILVSEAINKDDTIPTASIQINDTQLAPWQELINKITFGWFFKDSKTVTINATDDQSGIQSIQYYVSQSSIDVSTIHEWENYTQSFTLDKDQKYIVYAKVTDNAGNIKYVSSDGIVIYTDVTPSEVNNLEYTMLNETEVSVDLNLNGNSIKEIKDNQNNVLNTNNYRIDNGKLILKTSYLKTLSAGNYTYTVSYNPLGEEFIHGDAPSTTTISLKVKKADLKTSDFTYEAPSDCIYTGNSKTATFSTGKVGVGNYTVKYYKDNVEVNNPIDVGTYQVELSVAESDTYNAIVLDDSSWKFNIQYLNTPDDAYQLTGTHHNDQWYISDVTINPTDGYTLSDSLNGTYGQSLTVTHSVDNQMIYLQDNQGHKTGDISVGRISIDKTNPTLTISGDTNHYLQNDNVNIQYNIGSSGLKSIKVKKDEGNWIDITGNSYQVTSNGTYTFELKNNADVSVTQSITYDKIDTTKPIVSIDSHGYTENTWTNNNIQLSISNSADNLGNSIIQYKIGNGDWTEYTQPIDVIDDTNETRYSFRIISASGVVSDEKSFVVKKDSVKPSVEAYYEDNLFKEFLNTLTFGLFFNDTVHVSIVGTDELSGIQEYQYKINEQEYNVTSSTCTFDIEPQFKGQIKNVKVIDNAGNISDVKSYEYFSVDHEKPTKPVIDTKGYVQGEYSSQDVVVYASQSVSLSGIDHYQYSLDKGIHWIDMQVEEMYHGDATNPSSVLKSKVVVSENGEFEYWIRSVSHSGIYSDIEKVQIHIDKQKPNLVIDSGVYEDGQWTDKDIILCVENTTHNLGKLAIEYCINDGEWKIYSGDIIVDKDFVGTYSFRVESMSGLIDEKSIKVKRDTVAPRLQINHLEVEDESVYYGDIILTGIDDHFSMMKIDGVNVKQETILVADNKTHEIVLMDELGHTSIYHMTVYKKYQVSYESQYPIIINNITPDSDIYYGSCYEGYIKASQGYVLDSIQVFMNDINITQDCVNNGHIYIKEVYDDITIQVKLLSDYIEIHKDIYKDFNYQKGHNDNTYIKNVDSHTKKLDLSELLENYKNTPYEVYFNDVKIKNIQEIPLKLGQNKITIVLFAESGKKQEISLIIERELYELPNYIYNLNHQDELMMRCEGELEDFRELKIDNQIVDQKYYSLRSGSTIITLSNDLIKTLSTGNHVVTFVYVDGEVDCLLNIDDSLITNDNNKEQENINQDNSVDTSDKSLVWFWVFTLLLSFYLINKRQRN